MFRTNCAATGSGPKNGEYSAALDSAGERVGSSSITMKSILQGPFNCLHISKGITETISCTGASNDSRRRACAQVKHVVSQQGEGESSGGVGPLAEIQFWHRRGEDLAGIRTQLDSPGQQCTPSHLVCLLLLRLAMAACQVSVTMHQRVWLLVEHANHLPNFAVCQHFTYAFRQKIYCSREK